MNSSGRKHRRDFGLVLVAASAIGLYLLFAAEGVFGQSTHIAVGPNVGGSTSFEGAQWGIAASGALKLGRAVFTADTALDRIRKAVAGSGWQGVFAVDGRVYAYGGFFGFAGMDATKMTLFDGKDGVAPATGGGYNHRDKLILWYRKQFRDNSHNEEKRDAVGGEWFRPLRAESKWIMKVSAFFAKTDFKAFHAGDFHGRHFGASLGFGWRKGAGLSTSMTNGDRGS